MLLRYVMWYDMMEAVAKQLRKVFQFIFPLSSTTTTRLEIVFVNQITVKEWKKNINLYQENALEFNYNFILLNILFNPQPLWKIRSLYDWITM